MEFSPNDEFDKWLHTQPKAICTAIAVRAGLRVLPLFSNDLIVAPGKERDAMEQAILACFRASAILLGAVKYSSDISNLVSVVSNAIKELDDVAGANAIIHVPDKIISSVTSAAHCLIFNEYSDDAFESVSLANDAISPFKSLLSTPFNLDISFRSSTAADMTNVSSKVDASTLLNFRLWNGDTPQSILASWNALVSKLKKIDKNWDVWIRWYESVLAGGSTIGVKELCLFCIDLSHEIWDSGPETVLALIATREAEIKGQGANFAGSASIKFGATGAFATTITEFNEIEVLSQTSGALFFGSVGDGPIDIIENDGAIRIVDTLDSRDSHTEVLRFTTILIGLFESGADTPNNGNSLAYEEGLLLRESLGESIKNVRPGLLIPRGEALRQRLSRNLARDDFTDVAPLSDGMESAVSNLVKAYNGFVSLDPELSRRDEASFGPDAERHLVSPQEGEESAKSAKASGVITAEAESAIREEGKVAPAQPDPANRLSRRFSEDVKNLFRATVRKAVGWLKNNPWKSSAGAAYFAAKWILANDQWLLKAFSSHHAMLEVLNRLLLSLKNLPLG